MKNDFKFRKIKNKKTFLNDDAFFSGVSGMDRIFVGWLGNFFNVFNEFALLFWPNVFRVITGPNFIFALPLLLSYTFIFAI